MKPSRLIVVVFFSIIVIFISLTGKVFVNADAELSAAESFLAKGDTESALSHFDRALRWRLPGSGFQERSAQGIWDIATLYEAEQKMDRALAAYRILRAGFYSTRSLGTHGEDWIERCNLKIASLMFPSTNETSALDKEEILKRLRQEKPPSSIGSFAVELGFWGWVSSVFVFLFRSVSREGKIVARGLASYAALFLAFYGTWLWGLFNV
ncbi:MAG: hypothetical protein G3M78_06735 [Candidatus Nitrohelix vancouverensis]|uniref:Tetratricopeptide repeat protein n=1 Tax=Candidatus Nitrohelix vancouverensis TaxID=2705534 RepID=A0A7T0C216_9BACT|nr:MAG: hypothetical protein G3M78_06735 [Candidatus Nitrohelix vancouverensis]